MSDDVSLVLVWTVLAVQSAMIFLLYRQVGLHLLKSAKGISGDGLAPHTPMPAALREMLEGIAPSLVSGSHDGTLLVFARTSCTACASLWPELARFAAERPQLRVLVNIAGEALAVDRYRQLYEIAFPVITDEREHWFEQCKVRVSPFSIGFDAANAVIRSGLSNNREHLRYLMGESIAVTVEQQASAEEGAIHGVELAR